jgi:hypothetical protein
LRANAIAASAERSSQRVGVAGAGLGTVTDFPEFFLGIR